MTDDRIEGRVLAALSDREVLIDRGIEDGVEIGMRFAILDDHIEVEVPGAPRPVYISLPKTIVKIVRFEGESTSVGRTFRTIKGRPAMSGSTFGLWTATPDRPETLSYEDPAEIPQKRDYVVRPGDRARATTGDEYLDED